MALKRTHARIAEGKPRSAKGSRAAKSQPSKKRVESSLPPPAAGLTEAKIVEAARKLIRRIGVDDLTMRMLANELGVSAMAVYYHIKDKDELLTKVREAIVAEVPIGVPTADNWESQMRDYLTFSILSLADYPGLSAYGALRPPAAAENRLVEHGMKILLAAGFNREGTAQAITMITCASFGLVVAYRQLQLGARSVSRGDGHATALSSPGAAELESALTYRKTLHFRDAVAFSIETLLKGLRLQLLEQTSAKKPRKNAADRTKSARD